MGFEDEPTDKKFPNSEQFRKHLREKGSPSRIFTYQFKLGGSGELMIYPFCPGSNAGNEIPGHPVDVQNILDTAAFFGWPNARIVDDKDPGNLNIEEPKPIESVKFDPMGNQTAEGQETDEFPDKRYG